jgi:dTDP-4-dehydrorhamnose 3,5-epimerase
MDDSQVFIVGANGQLGRALRVRYPSAKFADIDELDITNQQSVKNFDWSGIKAIFNAAAYTNVDGAETPEGKAAAWKVNDKAVGYLTEIAEQNDMVFVHISTAYVFDGQKKAYKETDAMNPLGEYAKTKAAADERVAKLAKHYIVRTDSVIGEGKNFVNTMLDLASKDIAPTVVADQIIRPTFTSELARAIQFLVNKPADFGIYNLTNEGDAVSWADFTRAIFKEAGINLKVTGTTYKEYYASKPGVAPRPLNSVLDLTKIESAGFTPADWREDLAKYIKETKA